MTPSDPAFEQRVRAAIDGKTKPLGALGRIEEIAARLAAIQGSTAPRAESCTLILFAADHGMAAAGVSAYSSDVTRQMVLNILSGGAASSVFARALGIRVSVVDAGVAGPPIEHPELISRRIGAGTANALEGPALSAAQAQEAFEAGEALGRAMTADVACFGEMGIGATSAASLIAAKLTGRPVEAFVGRGTGLDDEGLARKRALLAKAAARSGPILSADEALREYGGFEIGMMAGAMIGAAATRRIVLVDGFIAGAAAMLARARAPDCETAFLYAHRSAEAGHGAMLEALGAEPLLALDMRLGEGTGALLAWPLVKAAAAMLREMASFESAGVSGPA